MLRLTIQAAAFILLILVLFLCGCSHNPAVVAIGDKFKIGHSEYGEISYTSGIAITDISRENSSWSIEVDTDNGITFDKSTNTIKGVRKITRCIGPQITGNLVELAKASPEAALYYLQNISTHTTEQKEQDSQQTE